MNEERREELRTLLYLAIGVGLMVHGVTMSFLLFGGP